jgi:beta-glucosidase
VTITIGKEELSYFNDVNHEWVAEPGKFEAIIAASAIEIKGKLEFELR